MKKPSWTTHLLLPGMILLAGWLTAGGVNAQDKPRSSDRSVKSSESSQLPPYSLEVDDGQLVVAGDKAPATLSRIAEALRKEYPYANIVLAPELGQVQMKAVDLKVRSADLAQTLEALRVASGDAFMWHRDMGGATGIDPRTGLPAASPPGDSPLYILERNDAALAGNPRRMVEVFNLSEYLARLGKTNEKEIATSLEQIQQIVQTTLDQVMQSRVQPGERPTFQFHPGANLFIVIGPPEAIEVARKVVTALPGVGVVQDYRPPEADAREANEAFMRRYGLRPPGGNPAGPSPTTPPAGAPSPGQ
ncbi:MAG TPA: hypothetical protein VNZ64_08725 [Candidatus Acidoferrum sp.]|jgi:hypothetical protein|nr:hypothetical protein [Candidatus Acidoferrum sp.]